MGQTNSMIDLWKQWEGQVADGRYPLRQLLGATDRGPVFATESADGKKCAIKLIPADPQNADALMARWEQAAKLSHPHLLRIFHTGRCRLGDARMLYAVMECADEDLSHVVPVRSLTAMEGGEMLRPALEALAYLHGKGLVHGHVKPSNIMAVGEQLKISADGISAARNPTLGRGGKATAYDAPEAGTRGGSAAGDVWSVGVTLVEILTQRLPAWEFKGQEEPELPRMPAPFGDIAKQCLRRDPQARCTLAEIATRLDPDAPPLGRAAVAAAKTVSAPAPVEPVRAAAPVPLPAEPAIPPKPIVAPEVSPTAAAVPVSELKPPAEQKPRITASVAPAKSSASRRSYAVPAIAIAAVVLAAIVFAPKLLHRNQEMSADLTASAASDRPATAPVPAASAVADARMKEESKKTEPAAAAVPSPAMKPAPARKKIVAAAGGVGGGVVHQVLPDVPQRALETIHGTVRTGVRVTVDASGRVVDAEMESAGPSHYFANLAEKAAREWKFAPPAVDGQPAASEWVVRFEFSPDGAKATATQASR
jgi:TonB family protein